MRPRRLPSVLALSFCALGFTALAVPACSDGEATSSGPKTSGSGGSGGGIGGNGGEGGETGDKICLLHNCTSDDHCGACSDGRTSCNLEEGRCVACGPGGGSCPSGYECSSFGNCVPEGLTCPTDAGTPTISCLKSADCAACSPAHQVCETSIGKCVACTKSDTSECQSTDICVDNKCSSSCPMECKTDNDCSKCGPPGAEAHACHAHRCTECSSTYACPAGLSCNELGVCIKPCGVPGPVAGICDSDADCQGCGGSQTKCHKPINGGHGKCGAVAPGCSDLGTSVVVLPPPYNQYTEACSKDQDCAGVGINYNVGKLLRDLTGISQIKDASVPYGMNRCANITVGSGGTQLSCGICVPCKEDADCMPLDVNAVAAEAFGPLGALATAFLLDQLFGKGEKKIHMYCQPVAAGYGACVPCAGLLNACGKAGGGGTGSGNCDHDVCTAGTALDPSCGDCAKNICSIDPYCCNTEWDSICVQAVEGTCAGSCTGSGGSDACSHGQCDTGTKLDPSCNPCVKKICAADPYCCQVSWDSLCVGKVQTECGGDCGGGCAHDECATGGPLVSSCSACATTVCGADPYCCNTDWDTYCVDEANDLCAGGC